jgi:para-aminobenzoate synthetase component 2
LEVTGSTDTGLVMAIKHRALPIEGVQFHPESVLTEGGHRLLANWLAHCGDKNAIANSEGLAPVVAR